MSPPAPGGRRSGAPGQQGAPGGAGRGGHGPPAGRPAGRARLPAAAGARQVALEALARVREGAWANLVVPALLGRSALSERDRHLVTALAYGTVRMQRACDHLVDRHLRRPVEPAVRDVLRLGAFQLAFLGTPAHAAVAETVAVAPARARGLVNAVLRRVASTPVEPWPSPAVELSYPDWVVERLTADLGEEDALAALRTMDEPAEATERPDGYVQDRASQWVVESAGFPEGQLIADLCAGPGGKATLLAAAGARVVAGDRSPGRAGLVAANAARLGRPIPVFVGDAAKPPLRPGAAAGVLVDAPCSGLGVLRRRPDARWRVRPQDVDDLAALQRRLVEAALGVVAPGGVLAYSVCTLTAAETLGVDEAMADVPAMAPPGPPWRPWGRGAILLPQAAGTDGMFLLRLHLPR